MYFLYNEKLIFVRTVIRCIEHPLTYGFPFEQMQMNLGAAEATILSLSQTPQPYQTCKFILGKSKMFYACRT